MAQSTIEAIDREIAYYRKRAGQVFSLDYLWKV